jgi:hypothetical protein
MLAGPRVPIASLAVHPLAPHVFATAGGDPLARLYDLRMLRAGPGGAGTPTRVRAAEARSCGVCWFGFGVCLCGCGPRVRPPLTAPGLGGLGLGATRLAGGVRAPPPGRGRAGPRRRARRPRQPHGLRAARAERVGCVLRKERKKERKTYARCQQEPPKSVSGACCGAGGRGQGAYEASSVALACKRPLNARLATGVGLSFFLFIRGVARVAPSVEGRLLGFFVEAALLLGVAGRPAHGRGSGPYSCGGTTWACRGVVRGMCAVCGPLHAQASHLLTVAVSCCLAIRVKPSIR